MDPQHYYPFVTFVYFYHHPTSHNNYNHHQNHNYHSDYNYEQIQVQLMRTAMARNKILGAEKQRLTSQLQAANQENQELVDQRRDLLEQKQDLGQPTIRRKRRTERREGLSGLHQCTAQGCDKIYRSRIALNYHRRTFHKIRVGTGKGKRKITQKKTIPTFTQ